MKVLFRADGGPSIGLGHLARCRALAEALEARGHECRLSTNADAVGGAQMLGWGKPREHEVHNRGVGWYCSFAVSDAGYDWFVHDVPPAPFTSGYARRLWVSDAHEPSREERDTNSRILLNPCAIQPDAPPGRLLFGSQYALVRRKVRDVLPRRLALTPGGNTVLVTLSGGHRPEAGRVISELATAGLRAFTPGESMADALTVADLAICGAGVTALECAHLGIPTVLMQQASDQAMNVNGLCVAGASLVARDADHAVELAAILMRSAERRAKMSQRGRQLIDGRGAARVADAMEAYG